MKVIYVSGPYRAKEGLYKIQENINYAWEIARILWTEGYAVICPHANTAFMDGKDLSDEAILDGDLEILERCDAVVVVGDWKKSEGTRIEIQHAKRREIPVFYWKDLVKIAIKNNSNKYLVL